MAYSFIQKHVLLRYFFRSSSSRNLSDLLAMRDRLGSVELLVGVLISARAVHDKTLSDEIPRAAAALSSAKTQRPSCSRGQGAVLVVKSVQYGVCHNSARSVEPIPLALQMYGEIQGRMGKPDPKEECGRPCL